MSLESFIEKQYKQKESLFWKLQVAGWLTFGATRALNSFALGDDINFQLIVAVSVVSGFLITILLRLVYRKLRSSNLPASTMVLSIISCIVVCAVILSAIDIWIVVQIYFIDLLVNDFAGRSLYNVFVLLIWTGAYFIINYHFLLLEEKEKTLQAVAQAHQSQLKMLRYQLNPHFLFNTLNAISTLVLTNQSKEANGMLTKLSAFLRFSLVNQPQQKITIEEEVYALWLYLDIEKVRFQERLKIDFNIADDAKQALIPSLLLQPLIENAIKYAIAPMEDGGTISLSVKRDRKILKILLCDTGPGLPSEEEMKKTRDDSSGVGLANTKTRLLELYPGNHNIAINNREEGGLQIFIALPFETAAEGKETNE
ncbi:sensor histidine kinase [Pseudemcibacter aquimaris]|uniref:sensor histidine kinase n=1 Tax=Pseudemcibacter aquimaris TaxID=2857064 RepID=UPI002012BC5A|nr:histidine kinase [Pseudemcibacter aquimaris]MCC3860236.1 histidine kinase [Pseudemcibacter aquimaris]WDU57561.1 histidine kinase [Pseudemcibacter aquimaris]